MRGTSWVGGANRDSSKRSREASATDTDQSCTRAPVLAAPSGDRSRGLHTFFFLKAARRPDQVGAGGG